LIKKLKQLSLVLHKASSFTLNFVLCSTGSRIHENEGSERGGSRERVGSSPNGKGTRNSSTDGSTTMPARSAGQAYLTKLIYTFNCSMGLGL
jgi:hypothetical protein